MYLIPTINTEANYANKVYIDPTASAGGDGTEGSPLQELPITFNTNTAYLLKRGTTLEQSIAGIFQNIFFGAYGTGVMPIVKTYRERALWIQENSHHVTVRDIHFTASGPQEYGNPIASIDGQSGQYHLLTNITVAFCKFIGHNDDGFYPRAGFGWGGNDLIIFNNEFSHNRTNFTGSSGYRHKVIRNWWHDACLGSVPPNDTGTGDVIQMTYAYNAPLIDGYWAGNRIDASNKTDKYALMLNFPGTLDPQLMENFIFEYNTVYAPLDGRGGAGVRWSAGTNAKCNKNLVAGIKEDNTKLVWPFDSWDGTANPGVPYGILNNHIIQNIEDHYSTNGTVFDASNIRFNTWNEYEAYLAANTEIGLYGSDINPDTFLTEFDNPDGELGNPINITIVGQGSVAKSPDKALYETGESVILTPTPLSGWEFSHWSGDISGNENPKTITT